MPSSSLCSSRLTTWGLLASAIKPGFLAKAPENHRVLGPIAAQDLDGNDGVVGRIERAIDDPLPPSPSFSSKR